MATLNYSRPRLYKPGNLADVNPIGYTFGAGHTTTAIIQGADIVIISSNVLARAATNQSGNIAGYALHGELAVFSGSSTTWTEGVYDQLPWGFSQVGTVLPPNPGQVMVIPLGGGIELDINLKNNIGWVTGGSFQANINSQVGLVLDATTNTFIVDTQQSNKVATIIDKVQGVPSDVGVAGDLGARVRVKFIGTTLIGG